MPLQGLWQKKVKLNDGIQDIDLTDTFIGQSFHDEISKSLSSSQTDFNNQRSDNDLSKDSDYYDFLLCFCLKCTIKYFDFLYRYINYQQIINQEITIRKCA